MCPEISVSESQMDNDTNPSGPWYTKTHRKRMSRPIKAIAGGNSVSFGLWFNLQPIALSISNTPNPGMFRVPAKTGTPLTTWDAVEISPTSTVGNDMLDAASESKPLIEAPVSMMPIPSTVLFNREFGFDKMTRTIGPSSISDSGAGSGSP